MILEAEENQIVFAIDGNRNDLRFDNLNDFIGIYIFRTTIIKNKFSKAYANRLENENNLNQAMQPLLMESSNDATSLPITKESQPTTSTKFADSSDYKKDQETSVLYIEIVNIIRKSFNNPNELCDRLRILFIIND